jgi:hypothetical protein
MRCSRSCGRVSADQNVPVVFSGWLGLLRVLERLIASAKLAAQGLGDQLDA